MNTKEMKKLLEAQKLQTYFLLNKNEGRIRETTNQTIFFDKTEYFTFDELKELLNQVRKVEDEIYLIIK